MPLSLRRPDAPGPGGASTRACRAGTRPGACPSSGKAALRRLTIALLLTTLPAIAQPPRTPIILDTDIGDSIDDTFALTLALHSPELDIKAITTVIDDTDAKTRLLWKYLGLNKRRNIPIARGAPEPLLAPANPTQSREYDVLTPDDTIPDRAKRPAAELILETLRDNPPISIVAIGPLTNIALALKLDPSIKSRIERIYLMGGSYQSDIPEYNIQRDPEAARIVFQSGIPITAVGLDVTKPLQLRAGDLSRLRAAANPAGLFLLRLLDLNGEDRPTLYDPLAVAVIFRPDLVQFREGTVTVLDDGRTQFTFAPGSRIQAGSQVNAQAALDLFISRISTAVR